MFYGCSSLEYAPDLPAVSLSSGCYQRMFYGCSKLSHIKMLGKGTYPNDAFFSDGTNWCAGVAASGEILLDSSLDGISNWSTTWGKIVPEGWTVIFVNNP